MLFVSRGWPAWPAFTAFTAIFILARFSLGDVADRIGGAKVALASVLVEAAGLALMDLAPGCALALLGAALTVFGYALVDPGFGRDGSDTILSAYRPKTRTCATCPLSLRTLATIGEHWITVDS